MDIPSASSFPAAAFRTISTQTATDWDDWLNHSGPIPVATHIAGEHLALRIDPAWLRRCGAAFDAAQKILVARAINALRGENPVTDIHMDSHTFSGRFTLAGHGSEPHAIAYTYISDEDPTGHRNDGCITGVTITDTQGETLAVLRNFSEDDLLAQPEEVLELQDELLGLMFEQHRYDGRHPREPGVGDFSVAGQQRRARTDEHPQQAVAMAVVPESIATLEALTQYVTDIFACPFLGPIVMWDPSLTEVWRPFKDEAGASHFSAFMDRLSQTVNSRRDTEFRPSVVAFLWRLASHGALRQLCFGISEQATMSTEQERETCEDRVSLGFNMMQSARLIADIETGEYDNAPGTVIANIRQVFRTEMLNRISYDKYKSLPASADKTQVDLAYQVKLRDRLQLRFGVSAMKFGAESVTRVTGKDLDLAECTVKKMETAAFPRYLSNSALWQAFLMRSDSRRYAAIKTVLDDALTNAAFADALKQRLHGFALGGEGASADFDIAALAQAGRALTEDVTHEHIGQLTREYLNSKNLSMLLASPWPIQTD
jgi:hypothetical protein